MDINIYVIVIIITILLFIVYGCYNIIDYFNKLMTFFPIKLERKDYELIIKNLGDKYKPFEIKIDVDTKIFGGLYSLKNEHPKFTDNIILYSHGNGGNISYLFNSNSISELASKYTVALYDYREFGLSTGKLSEDGLYDDILSVWNYLIENGAKPENIIVYGNSMGGAPSTYLVQKLLNDNIHPKMLILESTFTSHKDIAEDKIGTYGNLSIYNFDNIGNIKKIDQQIPVHIMHSRDDEIIPYRHGIKFKNTKRCFFHEIFGTHNNPDYKDVRNKILKYNDIK